MTTNEKRIALSDLNACHEVEEKLTNVQAAHYASLLHGLILGPQLDAVGTHNPTCFYRVAHATAAQRCEALCRTLNAADAAKQCPSCGHDENCGHEFDCPQTKKPKRAEDYVNEVGFSFGADTKTDFVAIIQRVIDESFYSGVASVMSIRCSQHITVPQLNRREHSGAECGACIHAGVVSAQAEVDQLKHFLAAEKDTVIAYTKASITSDEGELLCSQPVSKAYHSLLEEKDRLQAKVGKILRLIELSSKADDAQSEMELASSATFKETLALVENERLATENADLKARLESFSLRGKISHVERGGEQTKKQNKQ